MILLAKAEATVDLPVEAPLEGDVGGISPSGEEPSGSDTAASSEGAENSQTDAETDTRDEGVDERAESDEMAAADGEKSESETAADDAPEAEDKSGEKKNKEDKTANKKDKKKEKDKKDKKKDSMEKKNTTLRKTLRISTNFDSVLPPQWSPAMLTAARAKLEALDAHDASIRAKAAALNDLEAYVYKIRNRLRDEDGDAQLGAISTAEQRDEIIETCNEIEEWLYDEGRDAEVAVYKSKQAGIKVTAEAIFKRFKEHTARPKAVEKAKHQLHSVRTLLQEWSTSMPHITEEEKQNVLEIVDKIQAWLDDNVEAQSKLTPYETAAFAAADVTAQIKPLTALMEKLLKKPKPQPKKVTVNATDGNSQNATDADEDPTVHINLENTAEGAEEKSTDGSEEATAEEPVTETAEDEL
ncbi:HSP70-17 [Symbiodinium microadriaticum]|nr:HSP70-17 [Symbiodinium microadriaticum]